MPPRPQTSHRICLFDHDIMLSLSRIWKDKRLTTATKVRLYKELVMDITGRRPEDSGSLSYEMPATYLWYPLSAGSIMHSNTTVSSHIGLASVGEQNKLLAVGSQSLAILPDWVTRSQPTRLSVFTSTYHLVACLVGTGSIVLVDQSTDGSTRFVTIPTTCPRRYGDQPFFVAMAQE